MRAFLERHVLSLLAVFGLLLVVLLVAGILLAVRVATVSDRLDDTEAQLARVEVGAGLFASQVTGLRDQLARLAPEVGKGLDEAVAGLDAFRSSTITFTVPINEEIPIETVVVLERTLTIPIQTTVPIDETIATTITVAGPLGTEIPLDVTVPVQLDLPVDLEVKLEIEEDIPIATEIPVELTLPVSVEVRGTELETLAESLQRGLAAFADLMAGFE